FDLIVGTFRPLDLELYLILARSPPQKHRSRDARAGEFGKGRRKRRRRSKSKDAVSRNGGCQRRTTMLEQIKSPVRNGNKTSRGPPHGAEYGFPSWFFQVSPNLIQSGLPFGGVRG